MYTPNDHLGAAHWRLLQVTSSDVPANPNTAYDECVADGSKVQSKTDSVNVWEGGQPDQTHPFSGYAERPLTPPLLNDGLFSLPSNFSPSRVGYVPPSTFDGLPHTDEHWPSIVSTGDSTVWNTDSHDRRHGLPWSYPPVSAGQTDAYQVPFSSHPTSQHQELAPRRASSIASSYSLSNYPQVLPAVQQWQTDHLAAKHVPKEPPVEHTTTREPARTTARAPVIGGKRLPDAATRRKQIAYHQKAEARRHTIAEGVSGTKRGLVSSTKPKPRKRLKVMPEPCKITYPRLKRIAPKLPTSPPAPTSDHPASIPETSIPENNIPETTAVPDNIPYQPLVTTYSSYHLPVYHYTLPASENYTFAQPWLLQLLSTTLVAANTAHHQTHVTRGFIENGTPLSLLVLHNATNPFPSTSTEITATTTLGVSDFHGSYIHWTTLAVSLHGVLAQCVDEQVLVLQGCWRGDVERAGERRFHRAYWVASNCGQLGGLLNRGIETGVAEKGGADKILEERAEKQADCEEGGDGVSGDKFEATAADLTNSWAISAEQANTTWTAVQHEVDSLEDFPPSWEGWEHIILHLH